VLVGVGRVTTPSDTSATLAKRYQPAIGLSVSYKVFPPQSLGRPALGQFLSSSVSTFTFSISTCAGASGILFALILSVGGLRIKYTAGAYHVPWTFGLLTLMYAGQEVSYAIKGGDNVSRFSHFLGGACGLVASLVLARGQDQGEKRRREWGGDEDDTSWLGGLHNAVEAVHSVAVRRRSD
jgi:hypothetical protein